MTDPDYDYGRDRMASGNDDWKQPRGDAGFVARWYATMKQQGITDDDIRRALDEAAPSRQEQSEDK